MKIVLTGGGTGGHFYPIIAVAEELFAISKEQKVLKPELYYIAPDPYDAKALFENDIEFRHVPAGKMRRYFSILNFFDMFRVVIGVMKALFQLFAIYPDLVFSKGGYASFPTIFAARILRIPVFIHDSDAVPGRVSLWAAKFAARIAVSYPEAAEYFKEQSAKVALVGQPIRKSITHPAVEGAHEFLGLDYSVPTILVLGGSQGAEAINEVVLTALPIIVEKYQIIHQIGARSFESVSSTAGVVLENNPYRNRYKPFAYLNDLALRMSVGAASLIVSRAGSGTIFEIALWGKPAIVVPIPEAVSRDQKRNAFSYARSGAAVVLEQDNLTPHLFVAEIDRLMGDETLRTRMTEAALAFKRPDAARKIAEEIFSLAIAHEG